jgi:hypothetical protein
MVSPGGGNGLYGVVDRFGKMLYPIGTGSNAPQHRLLQNADILDLTSHAKCATLLREDYAMRSGIARRKMPV